MDSITLQPAANQIDAYDQMFKFLSVQVMEELARIKKAKLIKNDSTPTVVEDLLRDTITLVLSRFNIYDVKESIGLYCKFWVNEIGYPEKFENDDEMLRIVGNNEIRDIIVDTKTITVDVDRAEDVMNRIRLNSIIKTCAINVPYAIDSACSILDQIEHDHQPQKTWFRSPQTESMDITYAIFSIDKISSTAQSLRDMDIKTIDVAGMLFYELIDHAISLENDA